MDLTLLMIYRKAILRKKRLMLISINRKITSKVLNKQGNKITSKKMKVFKMWKKILLPLVRILLSLPNKSLNPTITYSHPNSTNYRFYLCRNGNMSYKTLQTGDFREEDFSEGETEIGVNVTRYVFEDPKSKIKDSRYPDFLELLRHCPDNRHVEVRICEESKEIVLPVKKIT